MASIKSKIFNFLIRNRFLLQGKLKKEVFDFNTSMQKFRETCEKGARKFNGIPDGIRIEKTVIEGINAEWIIPEDSDSQKLIFYVHGGGYVSGSCNDHRAVVSKFASRTNVTNLQYEYSLAPELPFPHALNDSVKVYKAVLKKGYRAHNIIVAGESAGGGLALAMLLFLKQKNIPLPKAAVAISPWTDLSCSSDSYRTKNKVSVAPTNSWTVFSYYYVGENEPKNPLISPLFGDLEGLPPIYINSAVDDELYEDGEKFYIKALEQGVNATFKAGHGMIHCYPLLAPMFTEATEAMDEIVMFINFHLYNSKRQL
ncbi:MAG: alpha/beta hydrolase [Bacteroidetes bacterium]|nr:alpha/beta hydrolase [Bacteroidota bacterium]